ncbi:MAG: ACT domain-containing protein [Hydrogenibacillus sp.]|nr:ACT domain-containing protein [Hydrogenibacillus sp.]
MAEARALRYYLVREDLLPEAMVKTALAKHLLARGAVATIFDAVRAVGLSRSAYYKYKDGVYWYDALQGARMYVLSMNLDHRTGVLSRVLTALAELGANILTIHQTIPLQEVAHVTVSLELGNGEERPIDADAPNGGLSREEPESVLLKRLSGIDGVSKVEIIGRGSPSGALHESR